jgi:hypothetical protein
MLLDSLKTRTHSTFGYRLVDSVSVRDEIQNLLFTALILNVVGVFVGGNLLLSNQVIFWPSSLITIYCLGIVFFMYCHDCMIVFLGHLYLSTA